MFFLNFALVIMLSLIAGSFITMLVHRLPIMLMRQENQDKNIQSVMAKPAETQIEEQNISLFYPLRSYCPQCHKTLPWYLNVPLISFILLRGRCKYCNQSIPLRYFLIESISLVMGLIVFTTYGVDYPNYGLRIDTFYSDGLRGYGLLLLGWALLTLACIDLKHYILPDQITLPILWLGLLLNAWNLYVPVNRAIFGAAMGYVLLWVIYWVYFFLKKKEGLGYGDFKLLALAGAWGGWTLILPVLFLASLTALLFHLPMLIKKQYQQPIPFGPYLALSSWFLLVFPEIQRYFYF